MTLSGNASSLAAPVDATTGPEANAAGQGDSFNAGMKDLHSRIAANPFTAGELKYHTPMGHPVYSAASGPASVSTNRDRW